ncbi:IS21 family transposase, partial [Desulfobacterota bacterium M19]
YSDYSAAEVSTAVDLALENHLSSSEAVHHILIYTSDTAATIPPLNNWASLPPPDIAVYGQLGGVR